MKLKQQGLEQHLGTLGFVIALGVFFGVSFCWSSLQPVLVDLGLQPVEGAAALKQQKLVGAVLAFVAMVPLLVLQLVLTRRKARAAAAAA